MLTKPGRLFDSGSRARGASPWLTEDGVFGPWTEAAVRALQPAPPASFLTGALKQGPLRVVFRGVHLGTAAASSGSTCSGNTAALSPANPPASVLMACGGAA